MRRLGVLYLPLVFALVCGSFSAAMAQDMFSPDYPKLEQITNKNQKEYEDCQKLLSTIHHTYSKNIWELRDSGKLDQALEQQRTALALLKQSTFESDRSKDYIRRAILECHRNIAGLYRSSAKFEAAGKALMEGFNAPTSLHDYTIALDAGRDFMNARNYNLAAESYHKALDAADDSKIIWAQQGIWKALLKQGKSNLVLEELQSAEAKLKTITNPSIARSYRTAMMETYQQIGLKGDASRLHKDLDSKNCPQCGSDKDVIPIIYGYVEHAPPGVALGGCCVAPDSPRWYCSKDKVCF